MSVVAAEADAPFGRRDLPVAVWDVEHALIAEEALRIGPSPWTPAEAQIAPLVEDEHLRRAVGVLFFEAQRLIDAHEVNVVILAARRLVCVYDLLVAKGMAPLAGCVVVSDRQLETSTELSGNAQDDVHALVLDDSVILGSTLRRLDQLLRGKLGSSGSVRHRAVCVDEGQVASFLFDGMDFAALLSRRSDEVQRFSADLVRALYAHQIPFFSDFPVGRTVELTAEEWSAFLTECPWSAADVTAPGFEDLGRSVALVPTDAALDEYLTRAVPQVAALIDAVKIRLYVRWIEGGFSVVPVPIAMVAPTSPAALDAALDAIRSRSSLEDSDLRCADWEPEAKHRLVQMYGAACVMAAVWPHLVGRLPTRDDLRVLPLTLYFGTDTEDVLRAFDAVVADYNATPAGAYAIPPRVRVEHPAPNGLLRHPDVQQILWGSQEILRALGDPTEAPPRGLITKMGTIVAHAVAAIFGYVNQHKEIPQRQQIRSLGSIDAYEKWIAAGNVRILEQGFTLRELVDHLFPDLSQTTAWARSLISLGIDEGNDLGVIVPITRYDAVRDLVYRSYRLGETANLAATPLVELVYGSAADTEPDQFVSAMRARSSPALPTIMPIESAFEARIRYPDDSFVDPEAYVRKWLPGLPIARFEGVVVRPSDEEGRFVAEIRSPAGDDKVVSFPSDRVVTGRGRTLEPGAPIRWTLFERLAADGESRPRSSDLVLVPVPPVDRSQVERDGAGFSLDASGGDAASG